MNTPQRCSHLEPKQADSFSYEGTTTEKNDQIYLNNMELTQSRHSMINILDSGNYINSNLFDRSSIQSFRVSKSNKAMDTNPNDDNDIGHDNDTDIVMTQTKGNDPNITIGEIQNELLTEENDDIQGTPISTLCNYYLKSEINSSKTKSNMKKQQISPLKITEFNYVPLDTTTPPNQTTVITQGNTKVSNVITLKVSQKLALNSANKDKTKGFCFNALVNNKNNNADSNKNVNIKKDRCRSSSVKTPSNNTKQMLINRVKKKYHSLKGKRSNNNNNNNRINKQNTPTLMHKHSSLLNTRNNNKRSEMKNEVTSRNNNNNNSNIHNTSSLDEKLSSTAKTEFNPRKNKKQTLNKHNIPINHLYNNTNNKTRRGPIPTQPSSNLSINQNQRPNTIVLEVTENDIISVAPSITTTEMKERKIRDLFKRRNQSQKQSEYRSTKNTNHSVKKALGDSDQSYNNKTANDSSFKGKNVSMNIIDIDLNSNQSQKKSNSHLSKMISLGKINSNCKQSISTKGNSNSNKSTNGNYHVLTENDNRIKTMPFITKPSIDDSMRSKSKSTSKSKSKSKSKVKSKVIMKNSHIPITSSKKITSSRIMTISSKRFIDLYHTKPTQTSKLNQSNSSGNNNKYHNPCLIYKSSKENIVPNAKRQNEIALTNNIKHITIIPHVIKI